MCVCTKQAPTRRQLLFRRCPLFTYAPTPWVPKTPNKIKQVSFDAQRICHRTPALDSSGKHDKKSKADTPGPRSPMHIMNSTDALIDALKKRKNAVRMLIRGGE